MRRMFVPAMLTAAVLATGRVGAWSGYTYTETVNGVTWSYYVEDGGTEAGIIKDWWGSSYEGDIEVPAVLGGYPVTHLDEWAFERSDLTSITLPDSVTTISGGAFAQCGNLTNIVFGRAVESIGVYAFTGCSALADALLPDTVTNLGYGAFYECSGLKRVVIGNGVTRIEDYTFFECSSLTSVTLSNAATNIGEHAFSRCRGLKSVTIPDSVASIGASAFSSCGGLTSVTTGSSVKSIGDGAFYDCSSLKSIVFRGDAPRVDTYTFDYVKGCVAYVPRGASGYKTDSSGKWHGLTVKYYDGESPSPDPSHGSDPTTIPDEWKKARTLNGAVTAADGGVAGVLALKCGKANARKGTAKVSASLTGLDGKKKTYKAQTVSAGESVMVEWDGLTVTIDGNTFSGDAPNGATVASAEVGGAWTASDAKVCVTLADGALPNGTRDELLPTAENGGEPVAPTGGKWGVAKAAQVKWAKDRATGEFGLTVNTAGGKTNKSGLKLTYAPKTGLFKGSFKVYAVVDNRLKKYTAKVTGLIVDGKGQGTATMTKPVAATWTVEVR